jgi:phage terminase large subunit-like protein
MEDSVVPRGLVQHVINTDEAIIPYKKMTASRSRITPAEPVAALYGQAHIPMSVRSQDWKNRTC